jgi:hypothetical protein
MNQTAAKINKREEDQFTSQRVIGCHALPATKSSAHMHTEGKNSICFDPDFERSMSLPKTNARVPHYSMLTPQEQSKHSW